MLALPPLQVHNPAPAPASSTAPRPRLPRTLSRRAGRVRRLRRGRTRSGQRATADDPTSPAGLQQRRRAAPPVPAARLPPPPRPRLLCRWRYVPSSRYAAVRLRTLATAAWPPRSRPDCVPDLPAQEIPVRPPSDPPVPGTTPGFPPTG